MQYCLLGTGLPENKAETCFKPRLLAGPLHKEIEFGFHLRIVTLYIYLKRLHATNFTYILYYISTYVIWLLIDYYSIYCLHFSILSISFLY